MIIVPLYYTNGQNNGSAGIEYGERSFATIVAMAFTWGMLFGPKCAQIIKFYAVSTSQDTSASSSSSRNAEGQAELESRITELTPTAQTGANSEDPKFLSSHLWRERQRNRNLSQNRNVVSYNSSVANASNTHDSVSQAVRYVQRLEAEAGLLPPSEEEPDFSPSVIERPLLSSDLMDRTSLSNTSVYEGPYGRARAPFNASQSSRITSDRGYLASEESAPLIFDSFAPSSVILEIDQEEKKENELGKTV